ncbi:hypothetical protein H6P81_012303 [Aristolochia fimbriata]|uniref:Auxin efflux carrier component n=1 Tax=Aristolochia fimbriata TaxID=158543 RepID=A0AAV7EBF3_ARIFI|nr:hypothetical protein H6P81_012303 [Aristolochia fimbriata]
MIEWEDVYKVVVAMTPLYVALGLGYGSVKWWNIFTPDQCTAINLLVSFFTLPLFTFEFAANIDPFQMNYRFIAADAISKVLIVLVLVAWAKCSGKGSYGWSITNFCLSTLTNSLVVGVPLLKAMYGHIGQDLVVQSSVVQAIVWLTILLFVLELREARCSYSSGTDGTTTKDQLEAGNNDDVIISTSTAMNNNISGTRPSVWAVTKIVWVKLALNPNSYASIVGVAWAFISARWHFAMPTIVEGSILVMSRAGTGMAMFSMGLFMALQEKLVACGPSLTLIGMVLRFIAGPAAMAIGSIAVGLHGSVLRVAIIQAALPQSITSFIYAREYGLHADVLSTAVIFGMLVSLPVLIGYYWALGFLN